MDKVSISHLLRRYSLLLSAFEMCQQLCIVDITPWRNRASVNDVAQGGVHDVSRRRSARERRPRAQSGLDPFQLEKRGV